MGKALSGELSCPCDRSCWFLDRAMGFDCISSWSYLFTLTKMELQNVKIHSVKFSKQFLACCISSLLNYFKLTASKKKRNLILDQTNVYPSARRRKMKNFRGFIRRAAVMVPDDPELIRRSEKRTYEDGECLNFLL